MSSYRRIKFNKPKTSNDTLRELVTRIATRGRVEAIVIRPERNQPTQYVEAVKAEPGLGLIGDRRAMWHRCRAAG